MSRNAQIKKEWLIKPQNFRLLFLMEIKSLNLHFNSITQEAAVLSQDKNSGLFFYVDKKGM